MIKVRFFSVIGAYGFSYQFSLYTSIWDNRYNAVTEQGVGSELTYTTFKKKAGGEILPGMLLIEGKYRKVK